MGFLSKSVFFVPSPESLFSTFGPSYQLQGIRSQNEDDLLEQPMGLLPACRL